MLVLTFKALNSKYTSTLFYSVVLGLKWNGLYFRFVTDDPTNKKSKLDPLATEHEGDLASKLLSGVVDF